MSITIPNDVKKRFVGDWADLMITDEQLELFIEDLENQAAYNITNFTDNVTNGLPPKALVVGVIANAIIEYIITASSPYSSESQSNGEFSRSVSVSDRYRRKLVLTDEDIKRLTPNTSSNSGAPFMINMGSRSGDKYGGVETQWFPLNDYEGWDQGGRFF